MRGVNLFWMQDKARKTNLTKRMDSLMKKTNELTILCQINACIVFFNPEEDNLVVWPTYPVAKTLIDRFYSMPFVQRSLKGVDLETFIQIKIQKIDKKLADAHKVNMEYDVDHLIYQFQGGCNPDDLSQPEVENLLPYMVEKISWFRREMDSMEQDQTNVDETDETLRALDGLSEWEGNGFDEFMENGSTYYMDINFEPFDADEDKKVYKGERSKDDDDDE